MILRQTTFSGVLSRLCMATLALLLLAGSCMGAVVYSGIRDVAIPSDDTGVFVNPLAGLVSTAIPGDQETGPWINLFFGGTAIGTTILLEPAILSLATGNGDGLLRRIEPMQEIGTGLNYAAGPNGSENHTGASAGQFVSGEMGFLGFRIHSAGESFYGWMRITVNELGVGRIHDWAFEDVADEEILAVVPEPSLSLLGVVALAISFGRRTRASGR